MSQLIAQSKISLEDQNDLLLVLPALPEEVLTKMIEVFEKDPTLIEEFNDNFKVKVNILINGRDRWEKLIAQEEEMLKQEEDDLYKEL